METYTTWWTPDQQTQLAIDVPYLNFSGAVFDTSDPENWPNGFYQVSQELEESQFDELDGMADEWLLIDIKPGSYPPTSPTGR